MVRTALILGATGLAGQAFVKHLTACGISAIGVARRGADVSLDLADFDATEMLLNKVGADLIVNCSAKTNLAECERASFLPWRINAELPWLLSTWCTKKNKKFTHISTDHLFGSGQKKAHSEHSPLELKNAYARQKYAAEVFVRTNRNALVLRTCIVGFRNWKNPTFAEWAFDAIENEKDVNLYEDAWTSAIDVATFSQAAIDLAVHHNRSGLINLASSEVYSKADFFDQIAKQLGVRCKGAKRVKMNDRDTLRSNSLGLDVTLAESTLGYKLPGLHDVVAQLISERKTHK